LSKKKNNKKNGKKNLHGYLQVEVDEYEEVTGKKAFHAGRPVNAFKLFVEEMKVSNETEDIKEAIEVNKAEEETDEFDELLDDLNDETEAEEPEEVEIDELDEDDEVEEIEEVEVKPEPKKPKKTKKTKKPKAEPKPKLTKEEVLELDGSELFILHDKKYWISTTFFAILNESVVQSINSKYRNNKEELEEHSVILKIGNDRKKRYFDMYAVEFISETLKINCYDLVSDKIPKK